MKILVLSLLRLGDVLQQQPLLTALRRRYPGARIDLVVNRTAAAAREVMVDVDDWIIFEREHFQKQIGTAEIPLMAPVRELSCWLDDVSGRGYDRILNFTHSRVSAFLAEAIQAPVKEGLVADGPRFVGLENPWFRHLNARGGPRGMTPFHLIELLAGGFRLETEGVAPRGRGRRILLQPLTSDAKKNWSLENWKNLLRRLREEFPENDPVVLGAPFEANVLRRHFEVEDLRLTSLTEARDLLADATLLVTGDTSIKHLAVLEGTPVLELALGSADPRKTGALQEGAFALRSQVACAPCPHGSPCRQMSHLCGEALDVESVVSAIRHRLQGRIERPNLLLQNQVSRFFKGAGWLFAVDDAVENILNIAEKSAWRLFLDGRADETASSARAVIAALDARTVAAAVGSFEREQATFEDLLRAMNDRMREAARLSLVGAYDGAAIAALRRSLSTLAPASPRVRMQFQELVETGSLPFSNPLAFFGHLRRALDELETRAVIRRRWLISMKEMNGGSDERIIVGNVFERGPEAP